jgi:hypothetical protein
MTFIIRAYFNLLCFQTTTNRQFRENENFDNFQPFPFFKYIFSTENQPVWSFDIILFNLKVSSFVC